MADEDDSFSPYGKPPPPIEYEDEYRDRQPDCYGAYESYRFPVRRKRVKARKEEDTTSDKPAEVDGGDSNTLSYSDQVPVNVGREEKEDSDSDSSSDSEGSSSSSSSSSSEWSEASSDEEEEQKEETNKPPRLSTLESSLLKIPFELSLFSSKYHWCDRFGMLTEQLQSRTISMEQRVELLQKLGRLNEEFVRTATLYGKVIIGERFLPDSKKTIPPVDIGGTAGGIKYIVEGILFKFAWDNENLYDGDLKAMKAASHELSSLRSIYLHLPEGVRVPLMVAIDFKGCKVLAISLLPVDKNTLVYGSSDGGKTVMASDQEVNHKMALLGRALNLKRHTSGARVQQSIFLPADIEVHRGLDGKIYMLDFSRLWPPEVPTPGVKASFLIRKLREEFVVAYHKPISSDAFSAFQTGPTEEKDANNQEALAASLYLIQKVLPDLAAQLEKEGDLSIDLTTRMHEKGANMRHLGALAAYFTKPEWKRLALTEACCRVAKKTLQSLMRKAMANIQTSTNEAILRVIVGYMNFLFGNTEESTVYWNTELRWSLETNFFYIGDCKKTLLKIKDIKSAVDLDNIFNKLPQTLGIEVSKDVLTPYIDGALRQMKTVLEESHILSVNPVFSSGMTEHAMAFETYEKALFSKDLAHRETLLQKVVSIFTRTAKCQSSDYFLTFRYWAKAVVALSADSFKQQLLVFVDFFQWLMKNYVRNPTHDSETERESWHQRLFGFLLDYIFVLFRVCDVIDWYMWEEFQVMPEEVTMKRVALHKLYHKLFDPALIILSAIPNQTEVITTGLSYFINTYWPEQQERKRKKKEAKAKAKAKKDKKEKEKETEDDSKEEKENEDSNNNKEKVDAGCFKRLEFLSMQSVSAKIFSQVMKTAASISASIKEPITELCFNEMLAIQPEQFSIIYHYFPHLTVLEVWDCKLAIFDEVLENLPKLQRFVLLSQYHWWLDGWAVKKDNWLLDALTKLPDLRELEMPYDFEFPQDEKDQSLLARLELLRCRTAGDILKAGYKMPKLHTLTITEVRFTDFEDAQLAGMPSLKTLRFSTNEGADDGYFYQQLFSELAKHCPLVEELIRLPRISPAILEILASGECSKRLRKLSFLHMPEPSFAILGKSFPSLTHISRQPLYSMDKPEIGEDLHGLVPSLQGGHEVPVIPLESLCLNMDFLGIKPMLDILPFFSKTLKELTLPSDTTHEHIEDLKRLLPVNLTYLSIQFCPQISVEMITELVECLPHLETLLLPTSNVWLMSDVKAIVSKAGPDLKQVTVFLTESNDQALPSWSPIVGVRKSQLPLIISIDSASNWRVAKFTGCLGKESDNIDGCDTLHMRGEGTTTDSPFHPLNCRLEYLQKLHHTGKKLFGA